MTKKTDIFDESHAPEVVKPLSPTPEHLHQKKPAGSRREDFFHNSHPSVEDKNRQEEIDRVPTEPEKREPSLEPKLPQPTNQFQKPTSVNRGWIVVPIILGTVFLICHVDSCIQKARRKAPSSISVKSSQSSAVPEQYRWPVTTQISPRPLGGFRLSAYAIAADDQRHSVTGIAAFVLKQTETNFVISTNVDIPCVWRNIPAGNHRLSLTVDGYLPSATNGLMIITEKTGEVAVVLQPLPARVRFIFPTNNVKFSVYAGSRFLGNSNDYYDLAPFIPHNLTFKARGWRNRQMTVTLAKPGTKYRCPVEMEKIDARLQVTVACLRGKTPTSGLLSFDGESPIEIKFPLSGKARFSGPSTLTLSVDGYYVLNNTQRVVLVDRQMTNVEFIVEPAKK